MRRWIALVAASTCLLAACGGPDSGEVVSRQFVPAHDDTYFVNQCFSYGKDGVCTTNVPMPQTDHVPDRYSLKVKRCKNDKCEYGWVSVTRTDYQTVKDGEWWGERQ